MSGVSVIIPAFNAARTLGETIASVRAQSISVAEIIVVDDGSHDATAEIAAASSGVQLLRQENAGPGAAANHGIAAARGEILILLDADDLLAPAAVAAHCALLAQEPALDGAFGQFEEFICPSEGAAARRFRPRHRQACMLAGAGAIRASTFGRVGPLAADMRAGNWIDWMDRAKMAGATFGTHEQLALLRRLHSASLSMQAEVRDGKGLIAAARAALLRRRQERDGE